MNGNIKKTLTLSLKKKWFDITHECYKTEDYREITPYWIKRLVDKDIFKYHTMEMFLHWYNNIDEYLSLDHVINKFTTNTMTLGYPSKTETSRIKIFEHAGIEIGYGREEWGAEPNKLYFIIKHGKRLQ